MLVRNKPFKEWITVHYDPKKTSEDKLLKLLRERRCPRATLDRNDDGVLTAMNPYVARDGIVQVRLDSPTHKKHYTLTLPEGWRLIGNKDGVYAEDRDEDDGAYFAIQVPAYLKQGEFTIEARHANGPVESTTVEVVREIGG